jgi:transposase-like protein
MSIKKSKGGYKCSYPEHLISLVCQELLSGSISYTEAMRKYSIRSSQTIYRWVERYNERFEGNFESMNAPNDPTPEADKPLSLEELRAKNQQLQKALDLARLENLALNTMIDIADEQLHTEIRKKSGAKQ